MRARTRLSVAALVFVVLAAPSCRRVYCGAMEKFGYERRDILMDRVNLNAKALGALTKELTNVQGDVDACVADLEQSISEADAYLKEMEQEQAAGKAGK